MFHRPEAENSTSPKNSLGKKKKSNMQIMQQQTNHAKQESKDDSKIMKIKYEKKKK
jgi:hypothetical protein